MYIKIAAWGTSNHNASVKEDTVYAIKLHAQKLKWVSKNPTPKNFGVGGKVSSV